ncbi:hypothetical protein AB1Y20_020365 [Prymnesium parvum]|uniref:Uncharacterized protein n=1 Tax=Prymnesium parvum TaxID=97485 RepID=A0AB34JTE5_PRYPA
MSSHRLWSNGRTTSSERRSKAVVPSMSFVWRACPVRRGVVAESSGCAACVCRKTNSVRQQQLRAQRLRALRRERVTGEVKFLERGRGAQKAEQLCERLR